VKPALTIDMLCQEAALFSRQESSHDEPILYGVTDGKAIGTYLEHKFQAHLHEHYECGGGSSAKGIDFPELGVDMKVTRLTQPQSSSPFRSARQKIYGLGYGLLIFVYDKIDDAELRTSRLQIVHTTFVDRARTSDYQTTSGLLKLLQNEANEDDIVAFLLERYLPVDETQAYQLAEEIMANPPVIGYLTISNALQWRLQYHRVIDQAG
jgi:hypothetical protein